MEKLNKEVESEMAEPDSDDGLDSDDSEAEPAEADMSLLPFFICCPVGHWKSPSTRGVRFRTGRRFWTCLRGPREEVCSPDTVRKLGLLRALREMFWKAFRVSHTYVSLDVSTLPPNERGQIPSRFLQISWVNTWCWGAWLHGCKKNSGAFNLSDPVRTSSDSETSKEIFYASQSKAPALSRPSPRRAAHICATCPRVALGHPQGGLRLPLAHNAWHSEQAPRSCRPRSCKALDVPARFGKSDLGKPRSPWHRHGRRSVRGSLWPCSCII